MRYKGSVIIAFAVLVLILITYLIPSLKTDNNENRTLATFRMVIHPEKDSIMYRDSPAERLDAALSDQFAYRETVVTRYMKFFNVTENLVYGIKKYLAGEEDLQYTFQVIGNYVTIEDTGYLTEYPSTEPLPEDSLKKHIDQLTYLHDRYPDMKMYVYYVTQAYDTSWFDNYIGTTTAGHAREIADALPAYVEFGHLEYRDFEDYKDIHYKTDHHWNHRGAQRGYENIYAMMRDDFEMGKIRVPVSENPVSDTYDFRFRGSYARALGDLYQGSIDDFAFYEYDLPKRETSRIDPRTRQEISVETIGLNDEYGRGEIIKTKNNDHYIQMYGTARDIEGAAYKDSEYPFVIRNSEGNGRNLLIIGDSYSRAIRDLLASHYLLTVYIDYRVLSVIPVDYVIENYRIDAVLFGSNTSLWNGDGYFLVFGEED